MSLLFPSIDQRRVYTPALARGVVHLTAGVVVGASMAMLFVLLLARLTQPVVIALVIASTAGAGACFAQLVAVARHEAVGWWRIVSIALVLPLASFGGLVAVASAEPLALSGPSPSPLIVFRVAFIAASAAIAFVCTFLAALVFGIRRPWLIALQVAAVTSATYALVALLVDPLPGLHVGGGDRAMPRVAVLCNFMAGLVGGAAAHRRLSALSDA